jgi:hypothetical protein
MGNRSQKGGLLGIDQPRRKGEAKNTLVPLRFRIPLNLSRFSW